MSQSMKALHDQLLADMPDTASHETCPLCADETEPGDGGGSMGDTQYTEAQLAAAVEEAVNAAVGPLKARIGELETSQAVTEVESAKAEVRAEMQAEIDRIQAELDKAMVEATAAKDRADGIVAYLEAVEAEETEKAELETRKQARIDRVKEEVPSFPEERLNERAERLAAMSDEDFELMLEGLKDAAGDAGTAGGDRGDRIPSKTGLHAARDTTGGNRSTAASDIVRMRREGRVDLTTL